MKNFKKLLSVHNWRIVLITIVIFSISLFAFRGIIGSGTLGFHIDWILPPFHEQYKSYMDWGIYSWQSDVDFGQEAGSPGIFVKILTYSLSLLQLDGVVLTSLLCIITMTIAGLSMVYLCRTLKLSMVSSTFAGIFFMTTPAVFDRLNAGTFSILFEYALLPLIIAFSIKYVYKKSFEYSLLAGLTLAFIGTTNSLITIPLALFVYFLIQLFFNRTKAFFLQVLKLFLIISLIFFLTQLFWILPILTNILSGSLSAQISQILGNLPVTWLVSRTSVIDTLLLRGSHIGIMFDVVSTSTIWSIAAAIPAIWAFTSLIFWKDRRVITFSLLTLFSIFLISASFTITPIWEQLLESVPILRIFRDPSKMNLLTCSGYAVLIGLTTHKIFNLAETKLKNFKFISINFKYIDRIVKRTWSETKIRVICLSLIVIILFGVLYTFSWPFYTGNFDGEMETHTFSEDYRDLWKTFSSDSEDYRVFMLPGPYPTLKGNATIPGYNSMAYFLGKPTLYTGKLYDPQYQSFLLKTFYENRTQFLGKLLGLANIKTIVLDHEMRTTVTDNLWAQNSFPDLLFNNEKIFATLTQQKDLELTADGHFSIFENNNYLPHISSTSKVAIIAGDLSSLVTMSYMNESPLEDTNLVFVNQLTASDLDNISNFSNFSIILQDGHQYDLLLTAASKEHYDVNLFEHVLVQSPEKGWGGLFLHWWPWYFQAQMERVIATSVASNFTIPISIDKEADYKLFIKSYFGSDASELQIYDGDSFVGNIPTMAFYDIGFRYSSFDIHMNKGIHDITIHSSDGLNGISGIYLIPDDIIETAQRKVNKLLDETPVAILHDANSFSEYRASERSKFFTPIWTEGNLDFWDIYSAGITGTLGNFSVSVASPSIDVSNSSINVKITSGGNYNYVALDHEFSQPINWSQSEHLSLQIYGMNSNSSVFVRIEDISGNSQEWRFRDNWVGWKTIHLPLLNPDVGNADVSEIVLLRINFNEVTNLYLDNIGVDIDLSAKILEEVINGSCGQILQARNYFNQQFVIPKTGLYTLNLRLASDNNTLLSVMIDDIPSHDPILLNFSDFAWYESSVIFLTEGAHNFTVISDSLTSPFYIDQYTLIDPELRSNSQDNILQIQDNILQIQKINPARYQIKTNASTPFYIFFSEVNNPSWKIFFEDGISVNSIPGFSFGSLYYINRTGSLDMELLFEKQIMLDYTLPISFTSYVFFVLMLIIIKLKSYNNRHRNGDLYQMEA